MADGIIAVAAMKFARDLMGKFAGRVVAGKRHCTLACCGWTTFADAPDSPMQAISSAGM